MVRTSPHLTPGQVFHLPSFRAHQLAVINATMSGHDAILVMPTGGGKSLTYQLPAVVSPGLTLVHKPHTYIFTLSPFTLHPSPQVVSPLLSLMEDQLMALARVGVEAAMLTSATSKEDKARVLRQMVEGDTLKLLYVTPEKCSKSKQFMAKLQKVFQAGRLARIAIDEVHCCSQWGHDFRPDYKFLGAMRELFPSTPILGLTATSTAAVTRDVKDILRVPQAMVFLSDFNRPNLRYSVRLKPEGVEEQVALLAGLVGGQYRGQSGIIYTTTVKEVDTLAEALRKRGLKAGGYHAQLEPPSRRSQVHRAWAAGELQVVVATLAFGMGIDKPDVRFVIHNTVSRSMENFYQESGRAGRDGAEADCVMLFRLADVFKQSTMVFAEQTGLAKLYGMVGYCLDRRACRRELIAQHFLDSWDTIPCHAMCDTCAGGEQGEGEEVGEVARAAIGILEQAARREQRVTGLKLVEALQGRGAPALRLAGWSSALARDRLEGVVAHLTVEGHLKEDFHFTPYSTISYLVVGARPVKGDLSIQFFPAPVQPGASGAKRKAEGSAEKAKTVKKAKKETKEIKKSEANFDIVISSDEENVESDGRKKGEGEGGQDEEANVFCWSVRLK